MFRALFNKIKAGLSRTRELFAGIATLFGLRGKVDKDFLAELERQLYLADVGNQTTQLVVERVRQAFMDKEVGEDVQLFVKQLLRDQLEAPPALASVQGGPTVIL